MNDDTKTKKWQEDQALNRYKTIAPLTDSELDIAKRGELRLKIAESTGISVRTLYRWEKSFAGDGFAGLKPMNHEQRRSAKLPDNFEELISEAIQLKREVPKRSVNQVIYILEGEGLVPPGILPDAGTDRTWRHRGQDSRRAFPSRRSPADAA